MSASAYPVFSLNCVLGEPTKTFVGTAQYVSPELLEHNESSKRFVQCPGSKRHSTQHDVFTMIRVLTAQISGLWDASSIR